MGRNGGKGIAFEGEDATLEQNLVFFREELGGGWDGFLVSGQKKAWVSAREVNDWD
jgi:hypothetical protein